MQYDFTGLLALVEKAATAFTHAKRVYDEIKDTLSETEQAQLNERLSAIHAENLELSATLDAALKAAETK